MEVTEKRVMSLPVVATHKGKHPNKNLPIKRTDNNKSLEKRDFGSSTVRQFFNLISSSLKTLKSKFYLLIIEKNTDILYI